MPLRLPSAHGVWKWGWLLVTLALAAVALLSVCEPCPSGEYAVWWDTLLSLMVPVPMLDHPVRIQLASSLVVAGALWFVLSMLRRRVGEDVLATAMFLFAGVSFLLSETGLALLTHGEMAISLAFALVALVLLEEDTVSRVVAAAMAGFSFVWLDPYLRLMMAPLFLVWARSYGSPAFRLMPMGLAAGAALGMPVFMGLMAWHPTSGPGIASLDPSVAASTLRWLLDSVGRSYPLVLLPFFLFGFLHPSRSILILSWGLGEGIYALWTMDASPARTALLTFALWYGSVLGLLVMADHTRRWIPMVVGVLALALVSLLAAVLPSLQAVGVPRLCPVALDLRYVSETMATARPPSPLWLESTGLQGSFHGCEGPGPWHISCRESQGGPVGLVQGGKEGTRSPLEIVKRFGALLDGPSRARLMGRWAIHYELEGRPSMAFTFSLLCMRGAPRAWECHAAQALAYARMGMVGTGLRRFAESWSRGHVDPEVQEAFLIRAFSALVRWRELGEEQKVHAFLPGLDPWLAVYGGETGRGCGYWRVMELKARSVEDERAIRQARDHLLRCGGAR